MCCKKGFESYWSCHRGVRAYVKTLFVGGFLINFVEEMLPFPHLITPFYMTILDLNVSISKFQNLGRGLRLFGFEGEEKYA